MKSLPLRYTNNEASWQYVAPKLVGCAYLVLALVAFIAFVAPWSKDLPIFKTVLELTSAGAAGIGIAMLTTYTEVMIGFVREVQKIAQEKGYIADMPPLVLHLYKSPRAELSFHRAFILFLPAASLAIAVWQMPPAVFVVLIVSGGLFLTITGGSWGRNLIGVPVLLFVLLLCVSRPADSNSLIWYFIALLMGCFAVPRKFEGEEQEFVRQKFDGQKEKSQEFVGGLVDGMLFGSICLGGLIEASQGTKEAAEIYGFGQNFDPTEEVRAPGGVSEGQKADSRGMLAAQEAKQAARRSRNQTTEGE